MRLSSARSSIVPGFVQGDIRGSLAIASQIALEPRVYEFVRMAGTDSGYHVGPTSDIDLYGGLAALRSSTH